MFFCCFFLSIKDCKWLWFITSFPLQCQGRKVFFHIPFNVFLLWTSLIRQRRLCILRNKDIVKHNVACSGLYSSQSKWPISTENTGDTFLIVLCATLAYNQICLELVNLTPKPSSSLQFCGSSYWKSCEITVSPLALKAEFIISDNPGHKTSRERD